MTAPTSPGWNVFGMLERLARSPAAERTAMTYGAEHRSFRALHERALRVARGLGQAGVGVGDAVTVLLGNRHEWPEVFFGIAAAGAVCVPVNVLLTTTEIAHICRDSASRCLVADQLAAAVLPSIDVELDLVVTVGGDLDAPTSAQVLSYEILTSEPGHASTGVAGSEPFIYYYSSGTTGQPKAAVHTHQGVLWNSLSQVPDFGLTGDDTYLVVPSLSWAAGFHDIALALAWLGGRSVLMPTGGTSSERVVAAIEKNRATHCLLVPSLLHQLVRDRQLLDRLRHSTMRTIVTGAEPVPRSLLEVLTEELPHTGLQQAYGLSEFPTIATTLRHEDAMTHVGSAGRPLLHTDIAVQTDAGDIRDTGEGELLIRSPATMRGYLNRPQETEEVFADGWLHTGDRAQIDDQQYVTIVGRVKDMIISGGLNVYPKEIEEVVSRLPGVAEVAVVGVPDLKWGETPVAVVLPTTGSQLDAEQIDLICREHLASYKRPKAVLIRSEALPRSPIGKILKRELRPWVAEQLTTGPDTGG